MLRDLKVKISPCGYLDGDDFGWIGLATVILLNECKQRRRLRALPIIRIANTVIIKINK
jgi:hypothetical protein